MDFSKLTLKGLTRRFLHVRGSDAERFLNGMWTADVKGASRNLPSVSGGRALLLNVKGKIISDAVFVCQSAQDFLFSIDSRYYNDAVSALDRLLVADDVALEQSGASVELYDQVFEVPESPLLLGDVDQDRVPPLNKDAKDCIYNAHSELWGLRIPKGILGFKHEEWWVKKGCEIPFQKTLMSEQEWNALRIKKGVPEMGKDYSQESLPLEFPLFDSISFHKGCYIGQEVIARATYRGQMVKSWVRMTGADSLEENALVFAEAEPDKAVGKLTSCSANQGLGLLRIAVLDSKTALFQLKTGGIRVPIVQIEDLSVRLGDEGQ